LVCVFYPNSQLFDCYTTVPEHLKTEANSYDTAPGDVTTTDSKTVSYEWIPYTDNGKVCYVRAYSMLELSQSFKIRTQESGIVEVGFNLLDATQEIYYASLHGNTSSTQDLLAATPPVVANGKPTSVPQGDERASRLSYVVHFQLPVSSTDRGPVSTVDLDSSKRKSFADMAQRMHRREGRAFRIQNTIHRRLSSQGYKTQYIL
jgi:hypothetical protein